jgi:hypothetical protein
LSAGAGWDRIEGDHLAGIGHHHVAAPSELLQAFGGREFGLLQIQRAALVQQAAVFITQGFQFVAGQGIGYAGRQHTGQKHHAQGSGSNGGPAGAPSLWVGFADQPRIVDLLKVTVEVFAGQRTQHVLVACSMYAGVLASRRRGAWHFSPSEDIR